MIGWGPAALTRTGARGRMGLWRRGVHVADTHASSASLPLAHARVQALHNEWEAKLFMTERVYGAHAAWEQRMDRAALAQTRRLPGVPSAHIGLDHVLGLDDRIDFCDVLGREWGDRQALPSRRCTGGPCEDGAPYFTAERCRREYARAWK